MLKASDFGLTGSDIQLIATRYFGRALTVQDAWIEAFGGTPDGFLADHLALKCAVSTINGAKTAKQLSFFVKVVPNGNPVLAKYLQEIGSFQKEIAVCEKVIPRIVEQIGATQIVPRYLLTKGDRLIVMENVKLEGYDILKGNGGLLSYRHLEKAFEALARMHAGSILLEEKEHMDLLKLFPGTLAENAWTGDEASIRTRDVRNVIDMWCEFMKITETDTARLQKILMGLRETLRQIYEYVKPSKKWRNVFSHGDLWNNNLMFRYTRSGEPESCVLVDFQLSRYTPPAYDINMLLALTTTKSFRFEHMSPLLERYYDEFHRNLCQRGIDPTDVYTKQSFFECCKYYRQAGQIHGCIIAPEVLMPQDLMNEIFACSAEYTGFMPAAKVDVCLKAFRQNNDYRDRLLDMVQELIS
ncbi:uncharacterized protein LOC129775308 [Toxorhynchites rutilus septentrionalis]|uniref:uncharacterized protein LOC129775308 n=1 Tax=Toxorhynchites rutilus septentrionalis TaxID=329112 RepID=UPI00247A52E0|nr:uncharacterized protein LOC129775308 [Toxorhynchites rutilus septentrionalis]